MVVVVVGDDDDDDESVVVLLMCEYAVRSAGTSGCVCFVDDRSYSSAEEIAN